LWGSHRVDGVPALVAAAAPVMGGGGVGWGLLSSDSAPDQRVTGPGVGGVGVAGWDASAAGHRRSHRAREGSGACQGLWGCRGWVWGWARTRCWVLRRHLWVDAWGCVSLVRS
jgi:hypothetical protein